jgi:hypothetical protein
MLTDLVRIDYHDKLYNILLGYVDSFENLKEFIEKFKSIFTPNDQYYFLCNISKEFENDTSNLDVILVEITALISDNKNRCDDKEKDMILKNLEVIPIASPYTYFRFLKYIYFYLLQLDYEKEFGGEHLEHEFNSHFIENLYDRIQDLQRDMKLCTTYSSWYSLFKIGFDLFEQLKKKEYYYNSESKLIQLNFY